MVDAEARREESVKRALDKIDSSVITTGGERVVLREALRALWEDGRVFGAWEPVQAQEGPTEGREEGTEGSVLQAWWLQKARDEVEPLIAKAAEYGGMARAVDLTEIGRMLVAAGVKLPGQRVAPWPDGGGKLDADYQELGIYFYLVGKFGRWTAAIQEGRPVSLDTLLDIGIYVRMVQRIRETGGWPV